MLRVFNRMFFARGFIVELLKGLVLYLVIYFVSREDIFGSVEK